MYHHAYKLTQEFEIHLEVQYVCDNKHFFWGLADLSIYIRNVYSYNILSLWFLQILNVPYVISCLLLLI